MQRSCPCSCSRKEINVAASMDRRGDRPAPRRTTIGAPVQFVPVPEE